MHAEVEQLTPPTARAKGVRAGRQPLPENLERVEHRHEPESCECQQCGAHLIKIGEDISELEFPLSGGQITASKRSGAWVMITGVIHGRRSASYA